MGRTMATHIEAGGGCYCLFATVIGDCGIAWSERGVTRLSLPEGDRSATERRLRTRSGATAADPPAPVKDAIAQIERYALGERINFASVAIDLTGVEPFRRDVYAATRDVGWGRTATYGDIARRVGTADAREVGQALSRNPVPLIVPCHRIVGSDGRLVGFSAYGGTLTKERLLVLEGMGADAPRLPGL